MASAKITLSCEGPEVRGSAAWITPQRVEWRVYSSLYRAGGGITIYIDAVVTGRGRDGRMARGAAVFSADTYAGTPVPAWLPVPDEWLKRATEFVTDSHQLETTDV